MVALHALYGGGQQLGESASSFNTFSYRRTTVIAVLEAGTPYARFMQSRASFWTPEGWMR
jgi:hypothetical protein